MKLFVQILLAEQSIVCLTTSGFIFGGDSLDIRSDLLDISLIRF